MIHTTILCSWALSLLLAPSSLSANTIGDLQRDDRALFLRKEQSSPRLFDLTRFRCRRKANACKRDVGNNNELANSRDRWFRQAEQIANQGLRIEVKSAIQKFATLDFVKTLTSELETLDRNDLLHLLSSARSYLNAVTEKGSKVTAVDILQDALATTTTDQYSSLLVSDHNTFNHRKLEDDGQNWPNACKCSWNPFCDKDDGLSNLFLAIIFLGPGGLILAAFLCFPVILAVLSPIILVVSVPWLLVSGIFLLVVYISSLFERWGITGRLLFDKSCMQDYLECEYTRAVTTSLDELVAASLSLPKDEELSPTNSMGSVAKQAVGVPSP